MDRIQLGRIGEELASRYLEDRGWEIVARNVRYREGELDIVAARGQILAFVEVKTRSSEAFGAPVEAVTYRKALRIRLLARRYLAEHRMRAPSVRFDVMDVLRDARGYRLTHIEGAF